MKPVLGQTTFGANTSGTTTQLDNNFLLAYNALNDLNTYSNYLLDTGSAGVIAVALGAGLTGALTDGLPIQVKIAATNNGATTLAYNGGGALNVKTNDGSALGAGMVVSGGIYLFQYRASDTAWLLQNPFTATVSVSSRNRLINASFIADQRNGGNEVVVADDNYGPDRWNILTQNTNCNVSLQTVQSNGIPQNVRLTQTGAAASRLGIEQIVEAANCRDMKGGNAVLSAQVRLSVAANIRYAIIEHTGTADTVVSDYVNDWNNSSYAAGNFFITANTVVTAVGVTALSANTWTSVAPVSGNVSANAVNLTAFFWTEANANQNVTLDIGTAKLEQGSAPTTFIPEEMDQVVNACERYYQKSFPFNNAPKTNFGTGTGECVATVVAAALLQAYPIRFHTRMRGAPSVTFFNPAAGNAQIRNFTTSADFTNTSINTVASETGTSVRGNADAGATTGDTASIHYTAVLEL